MRSEVRGVRCKPSSKYDADLGVMSGVSVSGVNGCSRRPFTIQHSQHLHCVYSNTQLLDLRPRTTWKETSAVM